MYEVSVVKGDNPWKILKKTIDLLGGFSKIFPNNKDRILIKPNFGCHKRATTGATTDLRTLASLIEMLQSQGYYNLVVGDGPMAGYIKINILDYLGVQKLCKKYDVQVIDLNDEEGIPTRLSTGAVVKIARVALESRIINLAKLKTHVLTGVTLGIKNLLGCVVGFDKRKVHLYGLDRGLADLSKILKPHLTIVEGLIGMEGRGPVAGNPIRSNFIVSSANVVAADIIATKAMGFNPFNINHINCAARMDLGPNDMKEIKILGTPLTRVIISFEKPIPRGLEANPYIGTLKHTVRGTILYRPTCAVLSTKIGSRIFRSLGIIQEETEHEMPTRPPKVNENMCNACRFCKGVCPANAIGIIGRKAYVNPSECIKCYCCIEICPQGALTW